MPAIDLKKEFKEYYQPSSRAVALVNVPAINFMMIDGRGAPASPLFQQAVEALYTVAYTIRFAKKKRDNLEYPVMALEGLWWAADMTVFDPQKEDRAQWQWTLMIMQPDAVSKIDFESGREAATLKKTNPLIHLIRLERFNEGPAAQIMHIGPFATEGPDVEKVHQKIEEIGGRLTGQHHEIYLSDFRRADPSKLKTVLRQPYTLQR